MIPRIVPPLTGLTVLVTRPADQSRQLCARIETLGGDAVSLPAIAIEPLQAEPPDPAAAGQYDLIVFLSANAVAHGVHLINRDAGVRVAAIGKATAAALAAADLPADLVPQAGFNSEALLAHPDLGLTAGSRVLIVRGTGGRELLQETFLVRGIHVDTREVYRRIRPPADTALIDAIEARWTDPGIDVVTLTSVETLDNLLQMLSERAVAKLRTTTALVASPRIAAAAGSAGLQGGVILAGGADDHSLLGALMRWTTRAR